MIRVNTIDESDASLSVADLTPLLDVVFIVMVFLLFTANVQTLSLPVNLPPASAQEAAPTTAPRTLTVSLLEKGEPYAIESDKFTDWEAFTQALITEVKKDPKTTVLIAGDETAPLGNLVKLMLFLSKHNIEAAQVLMESDTAQ